MSDSNVPLADQVLVQTVVGQLDPRQLGPTLMHEHLLSDLTALFEEPDSASARHRAKEPIELSNLGWIRRNYFRHLDNLLLGDISVAVSEMELLREHGAGTLIEVTPPGIGRDPHGLARIAHASGINVVMTTGFYVAATHPPYVADMTVDELASRLRSELFEGVTEVVSGHDDWMDRIERTAIKAGIVKVGCTWPLDPAERRVLEAAAVVQKECGVAVTVHTGRDQRSPMEIAEVLLNAGATPSKVILGHLDLRVQDDFILTELAALGVNLQFDLFGTESSFYASTAFDMPSDAQRLDRICKLVDLGLVEQIVVSQDICMKYRLSRFGGHGYHHIQENVVPFMRKKGFSDSDIRMITVENPARILPFQTKA